MENRTQPSPRRPIIRLLTALVGLALSGLVAGCNESAPTQPIPTVQSRPVVDTPVVVAGLRVASVAKICMDCSPSGPALTVASTPDSLLVDDWLLFQDDPSRLSAQVALAHDTIVLSVRILSWAGKDWSPSAHLSTRIAMGGNSGRWLRVKAVDGSFDPALMSGSKAIRLLRDGTRDTTIPLP